MRWITVYITVPVEIFDKNVLPILPAEEFLTAYYVRMSVRDEIGVLAEVTRILAKHKISIESIIQKIEQKQNGVIPLIFLTDIVQEKYLRDAVKEIESMVAVTEPLRYIRVEYFD